jgi:hypothetical protein
MDAEHSEPLVYFEFTRRGFLEVSAGAAVAAALPAALLTGGSVAAATLLAERREVYKALVEAVALVPMTNADATKAGWATETVAQLYEHGEPHRRQAIDAMIDAVPGTGSPTRFVAASPRARARFLQTRIQGATPSPVFVSALDLADWPFRLHRGELRVATALVYAGEL